ncbi:MAG: Rpn family recombination-promoting nuclease/putative transposase [Cyanobacteria bacterium P01_G01_bin.54]
MQFLNPKIDFAFKKVFGSPQSKPILKSFLEALIYDETQTIADLDIIDPYQAPRLKGFKDTYLDVKARLDNGTVVIIEMQVLNIESFEKRILYNTAKAYSMQLGKGEDYEQLFPVVALTITDFVMFPELEKVVSHFVLQERERLTQFCADEFELVFAELPKFKTPLEELATLTEKWLYFMKYARKLEAVPETLGKVDALSQAFDVVNRSNFSPEELEDQEKREMFVWDHRNALIKAKKMGLEQGRVEGHAEGREQGLEQGLEQGKKEKAIEIARQLLDVLDVETISQKTGLTEVEIEQLCQQG